LWEDTLTFQKLKDASWLPVEFIHDANDQEIGKGNDCASVVTVLPSVHA
jgi:hypothetical protein